LPDSRSIAEPLPTKHHFAAPGPAGSGTTRPGGTLAWDCRATRGWISTSCLAFDPGMPPMANKVINGAGTRGYLSAAKHHAGTRRLWARCSHERQISHLLAAQQADRTPDQRLAQHTASLRQRTPDAAACGRARVQRSPADACDALDSRCADKTVIQEQEVLVRDVANHQCTVARSGR